MNGCDSLAEVAVFAIERCASLSKNEEHSLRMSSGQLDNGIDTAHDESNF